MEMIRIVDTARICRTEQRTVGGRIVAEKRNRGVNTELWGGRILAETRNYGREQGTLPRGIVEKRKNCKQGHRFAGKDGTARDTGTKGSSMSSENGKVRETHLAQPILWYMNFGDISNANHNNC